MRANASLFGANTVRRGEPASRPRTPEALSAVANVDRRESYAIASPASRGFTVVVVGAFASEPPLLEHADANEARTRPMASKDRAERFIASFSADLSTS